MILIISAIVCALVAIGVVLFILNEDAKMNREINRLKELSGTSEQSPDKAAKMLELMKEDSQRYQEELERKNQEIVSKNEDLRSLVAEVRKLKADLEAKPVEHATLPDEGRIKSLSEQLERMMLEAKDSNERMAALKNTDAENQQEITRLKTQLTKMLEERKDTAQKDQELAAREYQIKGLTGQLERLTIEQKSSADQMAQMTAEDTENKQEIARLKAQLEKILQESKNVPSINPEELEVKDDQIKDLTAQAERMKLIIKEANENLAKLNYSDAENQQKIAGLKAQLIKAQEERKSLSSIKPEELAAKDNQINDLNSRVEFLSNEAKSKEAEIKNLTASLERFSLKENDYTERISHLKKSEVEMFHIEKLMDEEKKALHEMKLRIQESKMKLELLDEKTKGAVESIAQFAQGKEFEEFRKSVHMDQMIQKYENEIKALQIKLLEFEKKDQ